jgi:manganese/zinc/iron transport system permease protein
MDPGAIQPAPHAPPPVSGSLADVADGLPGAREIIETLTLRAGFNTNTVILGTTLLGVAAGVIGVFALLRKRSLVTDALSHATLPGIGLAFLGAGALGIDGRSLPVLLAGAAATGVLGVACIQALLRYTRLREDAAIGIVLSVFFGAGVVVLSYIQANAASGAAGLNKFIYGQTAAMGMGDAALMASIAGAAVVLALLLLKELTLVCFDDAFARVGGWPVGAIDLLMMGLVVLVTVAGLQAVGLILVVAMLIIPPVAARFWTERLRRMVLLSALFGGVSALAGTLASSTLDRTPTGPAIVLSAGFIFLVGMVAAPRRGVVAGILRQFGVRVRIHADHALAAMLRSVSDPRPVSSVLPPGLVGVVVGATLQRRSLARIEGGMIALTPEGIAAAELADRRRRLWERYLVSYADIAPSHVDISADAIEHVVDPQIVASLESELAAEINGHARVATARHVPDGGAP